MATGQKLTSLYRALLRELPPLRPNSHIYRSHGSSKGTAASAIGTKPTVQSLMASRQNQQKYTSAPPVVRSPLHKHLRAIFSPSALEPSTSELMQNAIPNHDQARHLADYLKSQRIYVELLEQYNPMLKMDDKERIRLTARFESPTTLSTSIDDFLLLFSIYILIRLFPVSYLIWNIN